jgi:hypothetical protein
MQDAIILYGHPTCPNLGPVKGLLTQFIRMALPLLVFARSITAMKAYLHLSFPMAAL